MKFIIYIILIYESFALGQLKVNAEKSTLKITGTSSLHDWEMTVEKFDATGMIIENQIENLKVTVETKSMKSGKSVMDKKAYDAVKATLYPNIFFSSQNLNITDKTLSGAGILELAGKKKEVMFSADIIHDSPAEMRIQGSVPLKMTDYDIEPPTAMFGTLKTGDEVAIVFDVLITK